LIEQTKIIVNANSGNAIAKDDIKAVTYSELKIEKKEKEWVGEVVFDI